MRKLQVGSLFSGIGGFDLGFEQAGMEVAWQCEIDPQAGKVLQRHWPNALLMEDVRWLNGEQIGPVDVITGGFPCQDISVAGKRAGLDGERSGLWFEYHRVLGELRPAWVVIENVPGLLSVNRGADFGTILKGLGELGYSVAWRVLDAQYFGVAQRRRRLFIVGSLGNGRCAEVLFERASVPGDPPARGAAWKGTTRDVAPSLTGSGRGVARTGDPRGQDPLVIANTIPASAGHHGHSSPRGDGSDNLIVGTIDTEVGGNKLTHQSAVNGHLLSVTRYWDGSDVSATLDVSALVKRQTMPEKNRFAAVVEGLGVRRLTPTECERLQGFPDGWTEGQADSHRYRQLGNAVAVPVARWLGKRIIEAPNG